MTTDQGPSLSDLADLAEQRADLREVADRVLAEEWSLDGRSDALDSDEPAWAPKLWHTLTELGWPDLLVPDPSGGGTVGDLCVLAEAVGAAAAPVPLVTVAVAGWFEPPVPDRLTVVLDGFPARGRSDGGRVVASGSWPLVEYAQLADRLIVPVVLDDGRLAASVVASDAPGVRRRPVRPLDGSPAALVELEDVTIEVDVSERWAGVEQRVLLGRIAELAGVAAGANAAAVEYAKQRVTFGKPIGAYQAIKHRLVDQRVAIEVARALVDRAAEAVERGANDASACTAMAASWACGSLRAVPEGALQVFGGIGYTWEHPIHLYLRRAAVLTALVGPRARHRAAVVDWLAPRP